MKRELYIAYSISLMLVGWPVFTYFFPQFINLNFYNLIFITSLSVSIYCLIKSNSFTDQCNASWLIMNLIIFFGAKELLIFLSNILLSYQIFTNLNNDNIQYLIIAIYLPPLILLTITTVYGIINTLKHKLPIRPYCKIIKHLVGRRMDEYKQVKSISKTQDNEFNLTIDPND